MNVDNRERERDPVNPVTLGVVVPILQSLVTGVLAGVFAATVAYATGAKFVPALGIGAIVTIIVTLLMWLVLFIGRWQPLLEERLRSDLNGDGYIGKPPERKEVRLTVAYDGGRRTAFIDLPISDEQLPAFIRLALAGNTSLGAMENAGISRAQVEQCRAILFDRDMARWKKGGVNQGWELTRDGRQAFLSYRA